MSDTIFALSTPPGKSGVAVVRTSGPASRPVGSRLASRALPTRRPVLATIRTIDGDIIDRGLILAFDAPDSFTGEDCVEYHVHGSRAVLAALVGALAGQDGMRPAEPGEFSRRAFENGKLDLTQIEGLADLIDAETVSQRKQALRNLDGALYRRIEDWRSRLIHSLALAEASFDFADEGDVSDTIDRQAVAEAAALAGEIEAVLDDDRLGERIRDGLKIVIAGPPNAGKSTLINALVQRDVAITSPVAGTTRDVVETRLDIAGAAVTLSDTAGIRDTDDRVEREGVDRAAARLEEADLVLWVYDISDPAHPLTEPRSGAVWLIANKIDSSSSNVRGVKPVPCDHAISALTGTGMEALISALADYVAEPQADREPPLITRTRHRETLKEIVRHLSDYVRNHEHAGDIRTESLRLAASGLGRLTGRVDVEDLLDSIFSEFCIGK